MMNNISSNVIQGGVEHIVQDYQIASLTGGQIYLVILCIFLLSMLAMHFVHNIVRIITAKSCIGCKRLINCEKAIKELQETK